ncbi:hypothetical protein [Haloglycomyces albus]|uniref:hypothetical protein n=1 Tax=Haloglycomyces albus TaxID=526067 RepID=UPI00046D6391|nr:hypothetical protein [Haloglycomyces albus]
MSLSDHDVDHIEQVVRSGKRPRVVFCDSAGQIAGQVGKVVAIADDRTGEFLTVEFGSDRLEFGPDEIRLPERGELSRRKKKTDEPAAEPRQPSGPPLLDDTTEPPEKTTRATPQPPKTPPQRATTPRQSTPRRKPKTRGQSVSVTVSFDGEKWTMSASRGAKTAVKAHDIDHRRALEVARASGSAEVEQVVFDVLEQIKTDAEAEAERLRAQLSEVEERVADLGQL